MRDKGHCILNFDREPELLDFWERIDETSSPTLDQEEGLTYLSKTEIRSASDRVIGSRHATPAIRKTSRKRSPTASKRTALPPNSEDAEPPPLTDGPQLASGRQLARREEMSIVGISFQQRQALVLAEKKAQRSEAVARRAREWVNAKGANSQKFDQVDNQMKWGKQNHKLQPR
jgi:pre-60S factor REI1